MRIVLLTLLVVASFAAANILSVPEEYATIQLALDALQEGDTVQIAAGIYEEALTAPPLSFTLRGESPSDTNYPPAIIDPSSLPGSDSLFCLLLSEGSHPVVEYLTFRNREAMYPRYVPGRSAGIILNTSSPVLIRSCVFDSVYIAIRPWAAGLQADIHLEYCRFVDCQDGCVSPNPGGRLQAEDCTFSGHLSVGGSSLVHGSHAPVICRCRFLGEPNWGYLHCLSDSAVIEDCTFGPAEGMGYETVFLYSRGVNRISNCAFRNLPSSCTAITISPRADESDPEWPPTFVTGNIFTANAEDSTAHTRGIFFDRPPEQPNRGMAACLEDNAFLVASPSAGSPWIPSVYGNAPVEMYRNRFMNLNGSQRAVFEPDSGALPSLLRDNLFCSSGWAVRTPVYAAISVDARWNWWGDVTGPYHSYLNPDGLGQEVSFWVEFEPWRTDTNLFSDSPRAPNSSCLSMCVLPNPFNPDAQITLTADVPQVCVVKLYDVLGRHVMDVWRGYVSRTQSIRISGRELPSGIYFVSARGASQSRPSAIVKVVLLR